MDRRAYWRQKLAESRATLLAALEGLRPEDWDTPVYDQGDLWTVRTVVGHLADSERGMSIHVHKIRKGQPTLPEHFDLEHWNAGVQERIGHRSPEELLEMLESVRARTLQVMDSLQEEEWTLTGRHPSRGLITVEQYYETIHGHEMAHAEDIRRALEAAGKRAAEEKNPMQLSHCILFVPDMEAALAFYRDRLGLPVRFQSEAWVEFDLRPTALALHRAETAAEATRGAGLFFTVEDVDAIHRQLQEQGLEPSTPPTDQDFGFRTVVYTDPFGNQVELGSPIGPPG